MKIKELAEELKSNVLSKPNKTATFKSFASAMGEDFIPFIDYCTKEVKLAKERRIDELEKEIEKLKGEL
jgi:archaellum component FlaC